MRLRRQVKHVRDGMMFEKLKQRWLVSQIDLFENVFGVLIDSFEVLNMACISEAIEIHQFLDFGPVDNVPNYVRSDKPGAASKEQIHESRSEMFFRRGQ